MPWAGTTGPEVVPGALDHARSHPEDEVLLVGDPARIRRSAGSHLPPNVEVVAAGDRDARASGDGAARGGDSSITVRCDTVKNGPRRHHRHGGPHGRRDGRRRPPDRAAGGVDRPALAVQMVRAGKPFVLLDIGANPDSTPENLLQYARMGAIFAERVVGIPAPRVALLSIGEEKGKGDLRIQRATELLDASDLRFVDGVEGKDLVSDHADVVVTDAVTGNVVIKFFEGLSTFIFDLWRGNSGAASGASWPTSCCARDRADPEGLRLRDRGWLAAPGREGRGHHHPRPGAAMPGRVRLRCRRGDRPDERARPRADALREDALRVGGLADAADGAGAAGEGEQITEATEPARSAT